MNDNDTVNISISALNSIMNARMNNSYQIGGAHRTINTIYPQNSHLKFSINLKNPLFNALITFLITVGVLLYIKPVMFFSPYPDGKFKHFMIGGVKVSLASFIVIIAISCIVIAL